MECELYTRFILKAENLKWKCKCKVTKHFCSAGPRRWNRRYSLYGILSAVQAVYLEADPQAGDGPHHTHWLSLHQGSWLHVYKVCICLTRPPLLKHYRQGSAIIGSPVSPNAHCPSVIGTHSHLLTLWTGMTVSLMMRRYVDMGNAFTDFFCWC